MSPSESGVVGVEEGVNIISVAIREVSQILEARGADVQDELVCRSIGGEGIGPVVVGYTGVELGEENLLM